MTDYEIKQINNTHIQIVLYDLINSPPIIVFNFLKEDQDFIYETVWFNYESNSISRNIANITSLAVRFLQKNNIVKIISLLNHEKFKLVKCELALTSKSLLEAI